MTSWAALSGRSRRASSRRTVLDDAADVLRSLPDLFRDERQRRGVSLREAADDIGCAHSNLWKLEHGGDVRISTAIAVLAWLGSHRETQ